MRRRNKPIKVDPKREARFWIKVWSAKVRGCCWPWVGYKKRSGHGLTRLNGKMMHAHKAAWLLVRGEIPAGLCVLHKCHNPACCNPEHMYLGTRAENMADRFQKRQRIYKVSKVRASCLQPSIMHEAN